MATLYKVRGELDPDEMLIKVTDDDLVFVQCVNGTWADVSYVFPLDNYPTRLAGLFDLYSATGFENPERVYIREVAA